MCVIAMIVLYSYGWVFERNESQSGECRCKTENEWHGMVSGGTLVCKVKRMVQFIQDDKRDGVRDLESLSSVYSMKKQGAEGERNVIT